MDIQLQELIDKIKKDGVANAETAAAGIVAEAEKKAASIINDAQKKSDDLLKSAKLEIQRLEKASEDALLQASRNILISFRDSIILELNALIQSETEKSYSSDTLKSLIPETVKEWSKNINASELSVLISEKDYKDLLSEFKTALKSEIASGLEIKIDKAVSSGFRIGVNNGEAYYDYSAEAVAGLFSSYLNPRIAEIMKNAAKENN